MTVAVEQMLANLSLLDAELSASGLTVGWTLETLHKHNPKFRAAVGNRKIQNVELKDISAGKGFLSEVYRTVVSFADGTEYSCVIKVPSEKCIKGLIKEDDEEKAKEGAQKMRDMLVKCHNAECRFYERFRDVEGLPLPEVYFTRGLEDDLVVPGVIFMEDLSHVGYSGGIVTSVTVQQAKNVARHLAAFHKYLLCAPPDDLKMEEGANFHTQESPEEMFQMFWATLIAHNPPLFEPLLEQIRPFVSATFGKFALIERPVEIGLPSLLCHGDLWTNNMLFQKGADSAGTNDVCAFIDWQGVFYGSQMFDLARFVTMCADAEIRREVNGFIVPFYFDELTERLAAAGRTPEFTLAQLEEAYKLATIQQATECTIIAPFMEKSWADSGVDARLIEVRAAKLYLRVRFAIEDAMLLAKEVAPQFLK